LSLSNVCATYFMKPLLSMHADGQGVCISCTVCMCVCVCVCVCVCLLVCTVTDYYGDDKATGVKFCTVVHGRPGKGISHFGKLCSPKPKIGWIWARRKYCRYTPVPFTDVERAGHSRARPTHGMCGYTAVPMIDVFVLFRLLLYVIQICIEVLCSLCHVQNEPH